jgi:serine/threonine-protein kinase SRPK3
MTAIEDKSIFDAFTEGELNHPLPRKLVDGVTVYASRMFDNLRTSGHSVLSDFGSAVRGDEKRNHYAMPDIYRVSMNLNCLHGSK